MSKTWHRNIAEEINLLPVLRTPQCGSHLLQEQPKKWGMTDKELFAIMYGLEKTTGIRQGSFTQVWTDHKALTGELSLAIYLDDCV